MKFKLFKITDLSEYIYYVIKGKKPKGTNDERKNKGIWKVYFKEILRAPPTL